VGFIVRKASNPDLRFVSGGPVIGFQKRQVDCGDRITLTRQEVRWLPDGRIDFDISYRYEEFNDVFAKGFKNTISWNEHNYAGRTPKLLVEHTNQQIAGKGEKSVTTHAAIDRPEFGMLILELNKDQLLKEIDRFSNRCSVALYFKGFNQDLTVTDIKLKTKNPKVNQKLTFDITVKNGGKETAEASTAGIRLGGGGKVIEFPVPQLEPKKHFTRRIILPGLGIAQKYRITVTADYNNRIREVNEGNNEKYKTFKVKK
jgi:subtilase family serine protease